MRDNKDIDTFSDYMNDETRVSPLERERINSEIARMNNEPTRRKTREVKAGNTTIGGNAPITVQSMLNKRASDIEGSVAQAVELERAGCQLIRAAVPDMAGVRLISALKNVVSVPIVADVHFDYRVAVACAEAGVDKIRLNPGNISSTEREKAVAGACRSRGIPIRIGVNSGSLEKDLLAKHGGATPEAMAESAMRHAALLERHDFNDIVISIKSSDVSKMIRAYGLVAERCDYPLHLGVTEAGTYRLGVVKSSIGIGALLAQGIGDTIRVSLTDDPVREVAAGRDILKALNLAGECPRVVSCPTCGRTKIDLIRVADEVERRLAWCRKGITVAVMGCEVNGPGEASAADIGIAGGDGFALLFKKGVIVRRVAEDKIVDELMAEIGQMLA